MICDAGGKKLTPSQKLFFLSSMQSWLIVQCSFRWYCRFNRLWDWRRPLWSQIKRVH
jgi:hypothetical protein